MIKTTYIKNIYKTLNFWIEGVVYVTSIIFAFNLVNHSIFHIRSKVGFILIILGGVFGFLIAVVIYRKKINLAKVFESKGIIVSILSKTLTTSALTIFIGKFFIFELESIWQQVFSINFPEAINQTACYFIAVPILLFSIFVPASLLMLLGIKIGKEKKNPFLKYLLILIALIYIVAIACLVGYFVDEQSFRVFSEKIIIFIVGLIFIHWIYELFTPSSFPFKVFSFMERHKDYPVNKSL
ncbi:MAG: hypothetical protein U9P88_01865 [Patescibacteria group bacterium]|nr:hypothetical protein [Patescibacteria group bacterium]